LAVGVTRNSRSSGAAPGGVSGAAFGDKTTGADCGVAGLSNAEGKTGTAELPSVVGVVRGGCAGATSGGCSGPGACGAAAAVPDETGEGRGAEAEAAALWACAGSIVDQARVNAMNIKKERVIRIPQDGKGATVGKRRPGRRKRMPRTGRGLARKHPL